MTGATTRQGRSTRWAVLRAIWTGHAPDARIDALARDAADYTVRNVWQPIFYAIILAIELALIAYRLLAGPPMPTDSLLTWMSVAGVNAAMVGLLMFQQ